MMEFVKEKEKEFEAKIDDNLLNHLGFLFIRDPLVVFHEKTNDPHSTLDFEVNYIKYVNF